MCRRQIDQDPEKSKDVLQNPLPHSLTPASCWVFQAPTPSLCTEEASGHSAPAKPYPGLAIDWAQGATRAVNQARACYNLLYLVTSYLFPYLSFGRGRCGAICLPLLEPVAKKCLSRFTSHSLSLQPAPSLCCPKLGVPASVPLLLPPPAHVLTILTFAILGPETERITDSFLYICTFCQLLDTCGHMESWHQNRLLPSLNS